MTTADAPKPSPFAGIPISDFLRDGVALTLLLVSFAMPWNHADVATERIEVILITLLSVFSLSITYLARAGVLPATATVRTVWMLRLIANIPYVVLVIVYLIIDAASGAGYVSGGVGYAAAYGLAGAIIAAQPRQAEVRALEPGAPIGERWFHIVIGFGLVSVAAGIASLVLIIVRPGIGYARPIEVFVIVASVLVNLIGVALVYAGIVRRSESGRLVAAAIGGIVLGAMLIDLFSRFAISFGGIESLHAVGFGALLYAAVAGLATSPAVRLAMTPVDAAVAWVRAASVLFVVTAALAAYVALLAILALALGGLGTGYTGFGIGTIVTTVAIALVAIVGRAMLAGTSGNRLLALGAAGVLLLLGIVHVVITATGAQVAILDLVLAFGLPVATLAYLTVPAPMREQFASFAPRQRADGSVPSFVEQLDKPDDTLTGKVPVVKARRTPAAAAPAAPAATGQVPDAVAKVAIALDPATPGATLYQLAQDEPELRPYIAANPSTYDGLLEWLGGLGDPAIDAALARRRS